MRLAHFSDLIRARHAVYLLMYAITTPALGMYISRNAEDVRTARLPVRPGRACFEAQLTRTHKRR